jgi:restriction endonuclease S subunit
MTKKLQLNEIADIISGMAFISRDADPKGSIPVINASSIIAGSILSEFSDLPKIKDLPMRSPAVVQDNDLLMVSRSVPGNPFKTSLIRTDVPVIATSSLYIIRIKNNSVSPEYLNYFFNSKQFQQEVIENARGSTISHISRRILEEIQIPIPSKNHQQAVIDLSQNIQKQNNINQRKKELKEEIIQATFTNLNK